MRKKASLLIVAILSAVCAGAQSTYLQIGSDNYLLLDRMETLSGRLCDSLRVNSKGESRKSAVNYVEHVSKAIADSIDSSRYSSIDRYNMRQLISESGEWAGDEHGEIKSKHSWFNALYKNQYNMVYIKKKDFFVVLNPILNAVTTIDKNTPEFKGGTSRRLYNAHDGEIRGWIGKKIGFYTMFTDVQEQLPGFVYNYAVKDTPYQRMAVPGADYFLLPATRGGAFNYLQASGYIDFAALKDKVNITFGSGKHFVGDGITSLFLSDFSSNMPFLRLRTRIWKLNYETQYVELTSQYKKGADKVYPHKFATMHNISMNVTRWMNLGFFEAVVFDRPNAYEIGYLNPVVFTVSLNSFNGSGDKALLGFYGKMIIAKRVQLYGQAMLNEFRAKEFFSASGWYGNKWGLQGGAKYFDALGIANLDLQAEVNAVRPYTYSAKDTLANYTNYNQPLANPLGSGFVQAIGVARYQPVRNLAFTLKWMYYIQGVDTGRANLGNNIFNPYTSAAKTYGVKLINGPRSECNSINLNISWQVRRNLFIDAGSAYRKYENTAKVYPDYSSTGVVNGPLTTTYYYLGLRINAQRRDYSFF
ncbi:MAG: hypothetical protein H7257_14220 [Taibaiella sp.]|nr:hypothetical protein [Taibaiella sp.]